MAAGTLPVLPAQPHSQRRYTVYRIHVKGQLRGMVEDTYQKTYEVNVAPSSKEDARRYADDDFLRVTELHVEEVTTIKTLMF